MHNVLLFLVAAAAATTAAVAPSVNVAVVLTPAAGAVLPTTPSNSSTYFCSGGHPYMSSICPYTRRIQARGGFAVGRVSSVAQAFSVFPVSTKASAVQLATRIPRGDFGNFSAIIVTTPRTLGDALMWASANAAVGAALGMGNNTGPCSILNVGIADTTQFTNQNTSTPWYSQSFGALVPNAFGVDVSKLAQALYADEKLQTGVPLTYTVLTGSSSSGKAIAVDIMTSVTQSGAGIDWHGANFVWPDRIAINGTQQPMDDWTAAVSAWAQALAELPTRPDIVFVGGLQAEVNASRAILYGWMTAKTPWRPKVTLFAGGSVPSTPDDLFVDTLFARQWSRSMRGIERDVKDVQGASEPWISDPVLGIQAPEVFARDIDPMTAIAETLRTDPLGPAIGGLTLVWLQKAMQIGCRDISVIEECDGRKIAAGLASVTAAPSFFGPISSVNGQIAALSFFLTQFSDDLTQTYLSPSGSSNGTLHWSREWDQLMVTLTTSFQPASYAVSGAILLFGATSAVSQYVWVILAKRRSRRYRDVITAMVGAMLNTDGVLYCGQVLVVSSLVFGNLAPWQKLMGFKGFYLGMSALLCLVGSAVTVRGLYAVVGARDARDVDDNQSVGTSSPGISSSSHVKRMSSSVSVDVANDTASSTRAVKLWLRLVIIALPLAACATISAVLLVLSVDADAIPTVNISAVAGSFLMAWVFAASAPACVFIKTLGEWRAVLGGVCLMISKWVPTSIIVITTVWTRYVVRRASLPASSIDGPTLFNIGCILFIAVLALSQLVMRVFYKGEAAQLENYVLDARKKEQDAKTQLVSNTRDFHHAVLLANVGLRDTGPKPYHGLFALTADQPATASVLTREAEELRLETVVRTQAALLYFLNSATPPFNRQGVEFLVVASMLLTYTDSTDDVERKRKRREYEVQIQELILGIRHYFLADNDINLKEDLNQELSMATDPDQYRKSDTPVKDMIAKVSELMPSVQQEAMKLVRTNQWLHMKPWHRNYAAFLCGLAHPQHVDPQPALSESGSPALFLMTRTLGDTLTVPGAVTARRRPVFAPPARHYRQESDVKDLAVTVRATVAEEPRELPGTVPNHHPPLPLSSVTSSPALAQQPELLPPAASTESHE